jgi:endonuclease-3
MGTEKEARMARETKAARCARALEIAQRMNAHYADAQCALLYWNDPFKLTVAVMLSAQTTDKGVNKVTPALWEKYPTPEALAQAKEADVAAIIASIGCYKVKAARAIGIAQMVVADFGGQVPPDMELLQKLPGVGRKTANIVLNEGFGIVEGIAVDTHVNRVAHKLGLVDAATDDPNKVEQALLALYPREMWGPINHQWVLFGRETCNARHPKCTTCFLSDLCPSAAV